jgi:hypothetical protein
MDNGNSDTCLDTLWKQMAHSLTLSEDSYILISETHWWRTSTFSPSQLPQLYVSVYTYMKFFIPYLISVSTRNSMKQWSTNCVSGYVGNFQKFPLMKPINKFFIIFNSFFIFLLTSVYNLHPIYFQCKKTIIKVFIYFKQLYFIFAQKLHFTSQQFHRYWKFEDNNNKEAKFNKTPDVI